MSKAKIKSSFKLRHCSKKKYHWPRNICNATVTTILVSLISDYVKATEPNLQRLTNNSKRFDEDPAL